MSEQSDSALPRYVICRCQSCDGNIEFDANQLTEENSIIPCPHCGLGTKLSVPQAVTTPTGAVPPVIRREGFFCGSAPPPDLTPPAEAPEISMPSIPQKLINSVGSRRNDALVSKLSTEGDQDLPVSCADARRLIRDPRIKMMNPETGERFTPESLEAFLEAKRLEKKAENNQIKLNEAHVNKCWNKYNKLKEELKSSVSEHGSQRISLTKAQCELPVVQELIALLAEIETEGFVADDGARKLVGWLEEKNNSEIPAFTFLLQTARTVLACGELTTRTIPEIDIALELQLAIERVLPKQVRDPIKAKRIEAVDRMRNNVPASKGVLDYIRELGGTPRHGMTAAEAEDLKEELYHQPTEKQIKFIRDLGGTPPPGLTRFSAMELIDHLLHQNKSVERQIQYSGNLDVELPPILACTNTGIQMSTDHFTFIELRQGSIEWLEWRHKGIGASDASTIMGENRFKSAAQLLQEKRGPAQDYGQNLAMTRGTELEPEARRLYVAKTGKEVRPACLQSTRFDWLRASLDGLAINNDAVVEIKCGQSAYRIASQTRSVPDYYYGQVQHILAVTGLESLDFWCYWPGYPALLIPVPRNDSYIQRLLEKELEFWNLVQQR